MVAHEVVFVCGDGGFYQSVLPRPIEEISTRLSEYITPEKKRKRKIGLRVVVLHLLERILVSKDDSTDEILELQRNQ